MELIEECKAELARIQALLSAMRDLHDPETEMVKVRLQDVWDRLSRLVAMLEQQGQ